MRILSVITARGGSKRLPGKNIRTLDGKPLIVWSLDAVKGVSDICDVLVSTDDSAIADIARAEGGMVPWLRPSELATDEASSVDVCIHALDWYEAVHGRVDGLLLLQPTSPFRSKETILRGLRKFYASKQGLVVGVSPAKSHPAWCYKVDGDAVRPFVKGKHLRSQDLPAAYVANGAFYLITPECLRGSKSFYDGMVPLIMNSRAESLDIDTEWDWMLAETLLRYDSIKPGQCFHRNVFGDMT